MAFLPNQKSAVDPDTPVVSPQKLTAKLIRTTSGIAKESAQDVVSDFPEMLDLWGVLTIFMC